MPLPARALATAVTISLAVACGGTDGGGGAEAGRSGADEAARDAGAEAASGELGATVRGRAPPATGGIPSMVMLAPAGAAIASDHPGASNHPATPATGPDAVVDQFGLAFSPRVLVVRDGSPVRFTNSEGAITHNVHVRSIAGDSTVFNGDTGPTEGVDVDLPGPRGYDVLCDMHPGMTGFVFVTDAPYATAAEPDGSFVIAGLAPGEYRARLWTAGSGFGDERHVVAGGGDVTLDLVTPG